MSEKISKISVDNVVYDLSVDMSSVDAKVSELENKISEGDAGLQENIDNLAEKVESEATRVNGMVNQINENVASSIETLNNNLVQAIETINGGIAAEVTNREEGDKALQASIDELAEKINGESGDLSELEGKVEKNAADIATVNSNLVEAVNNINKNMADGFNTINGGINNEIRPELEKAVKYEDTATEQNPGRKTIFLNNHDNICGKTTDGGSVNIAMVSKWNKVDLGSTAIELNLNGSAEHPTYNDSKEIAFLEDVQGSMETIALVKKDDLTYELQVGDKIAGTINIPADQFLKSVEYSADDKSLTFVFNTAEGEQTSVVDLSSLVDTYVAGSGIELAGNAFSVKLDPASEVYLSVSEAGIKVEGIDAIKKDIQEVSANLSVVDKKIEEEIRPELEKAVKYVDIADENLPERKAIVLKNGDVILGEKVEGGSSSLVQLNRWGVADFGSASVPFNINTPKDVRPTVQEAGQSGEEAHKIAYLSDVESSSAQIEEVKAALETKADKADVDSAVENINSALDQKADKIAVDAITEQLATKADAESVDNRFATVNEGLDSKADKIAVDAITEKVDGISADLEGVVKYQEFGEGRKTIQLSNYDNISGIDTKGEGHNLVMLSKWDKADFGASGVELNLNGSADRPTYNDTKEIALTEDIEAAKEGLISYKVLEDGSKTIELANGDSLSGVNAEGVAGFNLAKVSADDKVEVGSAGLTLNLVGAAPRPVFNGEKGIALSEDLETRANELQDEINLKASQSDLEAYMSATNTKIEEFEGKIGTIPTKVSELENDSNFQDESQVNAKIEEATKNAVEYLEFGEGRKTIQLSNYDNISGIDTKGTGHNIAMISKWDKVDLGAAGLEVNLNGSAERPTYNDTEELALLKDVQGIVIPSKVSEFENDADYQNASQVDARIQEVVAAAPEALDTLKELADALGNDPDFAGTVTEELSKKANSVDVYTKGEADAKFITEHQSLEDYATKEEIKDQVKYIDIPSEQLPDRKAIELAKGDMLLGGGNNLVQLNRWGVVDLGTFVSPINMNTPKDVRPTVQEAGQSGEEAHKIAYLSDIEAASSEIEGVKAQIETINGVVDQKADKSEVALKANQSDVDAQVNIINEKLEGLATKEEVAAEKARAEGVEAKLQEDLTYVADTVIPEMNTNTARALDSKVDWDESKKVIVLPAGGKIAGTMSNGDGAVLAQVNDWGVTDLGSSKLPTTINSIDRPKVQLAGQSGEEAEGIAYVSEVSTLEEKVNTKADKTELEGLATEAWVESKGYLTEHQDISALATKEELTEATKDVVKHQVDSLGKTIISLSNDEQIIAAPNSEELEDKIEVAGAVPLVKLNKWNVVDLGSPKTMVNINTPKDVRPTVQEPGQSGKQAHKIAYLSDVESKVGSVKLVQDSENSLHYTLMSDDVNVGEINIPKDQMLKSVDYNAMSSDLVFVFDTIEGEKETTVNLGSLIDTYEAGNGLELSDNKFSVKISNNEYLVADVDGLSLKLSLEKSSDWVYNVIGNYGVVSTISFEEEVTKFEQKVYELVTGETTRTMEEEAKLQEKINEVDSILANEIISREAEHSRLESTIGYVDGKLNDSNSSNSTDHDRFEMLISELRDSIGSEATTARAAEKANADAIAAETERAKEAEAKAVTWYVDENNDNKKVLSLDNDQLINARSNNEELEGKIDVQGRAISLIQLNKWNVVELGSPYTLTNINSPKGVRPTVQEAGQSGAEANQLAYLSDINETKEYVDAKISELPQVVDIPTEELPDRKGIVLKNGDMVMGAAVDGRQVNIAMVNRWDVVDLGTTALPINLNVPANVRPTVQEAGMSGENAHKVAYLSDIDGLKSTVDSLSATIEILQSKLEALSKTNVEVVEIAGGEVGMNDATKDYVISGSVNKTTAITGKSIAMNGVTVSDDARLKLNAEDVELKGMSFVGDFPKETSNSVVNVNESEFVVFKDVVFDSQNVYNGVEVGLSSKTKYAKNILFENCKFTGDFSNNAILVFATQDNAVITLNNCHFDKVSNALRISNKMNAKGVVVNINNCTVDQWDTRAPWQGFLILEDYTSKSDEEALANNLFAPEKITINFNNLVYQGKKVMPEDVASVCGTKDENQVVYVCIDSASDGNYVVAYDKNRYPTINFN